MKKQKPQVAIIMGSESDLPVMREAAAALKNFEISYEMQIVSAHRTPDMMAKFSNEARGRGIAVIIAGAGGAAHLPGMVASQTTLPVIGVPVTTTKLGGLDALLSIVQMPKGVPVATVGVDNAANAGLLAVRILAATDAKLGKKLEKFKAAQNKKVREMNQRLKKSAK